MARVQSASPAGDVVGPLSTACATDRELLASFIEHADETAFETLLRRHQRGVWGVCRRMLPRHQDAEEAFQAVFLILARNARSIRKREALGSWLYGVAYRTALDLRQRLARRSSSASWSSFASCPAPADHEPWKEAAFREVQQILDEEVQRLPPKLRSPFVLCCLQGMGRSEAARELGLKEGTISGRLALARQLLQKRLARRGVKLSAALTAVALASNTAAAATPSTLVQGTAQAVLASLAAKGVVTPLAPAAVTLADAFWQAAVLAKVKAAVVFLTCVALAALAAAVARPLAGGGAADLPDNKAKASAPQPQSDVWSIAVSADGKYLASGAGWWDQPGEIGVWDLQTRTPLKRFAENLGVASVALSPDGKLLASGSWNGHVRLRDWAAGIQTADLEVAGVARVAFSPNGALLAIVTERETAELWDPAQGRLVAPLQNDRSGSRPVSYSCVAFSPDGQRVLAGGNDWQEGGVNRVIVWDVASKKQVHKLAGHRNAVLCVACSTAGKIIASGGADHTIRLWAADSGKLLKTLKGHQHWVESIVFTDNDTLVSGSHDGTVRFWDVTAGRERSRISIRKAPWRPAKGVAGPDGRVRALGFTADRKTVLVGGGPRTLKLFDIATGQETGVLWKGTLADAVAANTAPAKPEKPTMDDLPAAPPAAGDATSLPQAALLFALALGALLILSLGVALYARRRRQAGNRTPDPAEPSLSFRCSGCAKPLKAKPTLAGKTCKCPECGKAVAVPKSAK